MNILKSRISRPQAEEKINPELNEMSGNCTPDRNWGPLSAYVVRNATRAIDELQTLMDDAQRATKEDPTRPAFDMQRATQPLPEGMGVKSDY